MFSANHGWQNKGQHFLNSSFALFPLDPMEIYLKEIIIAGTMITYVKCVLSWVPLV
jgi:hypothetical protein